MKARDVVHFVVCALALVAVLLPHDGVDPPPRALASGGSAAGLRNATTGGWSGRNTPTGPGARGAAVALVLDDGGAETNIGVLVGPDSRSIQFIWLNRFTPDPSVYPLVLNQIHVLFDKTENSGVSPGDAIDLVVYEDADSNPANGATLLATFHETVQVADGDTWSVHDLSTPVVIENPGDVLLGVINRFVTTGVTETTYPARMDTTTSYGRSWLGWWNGDPPDPATLPTDSTLDVADNMGLPGNWMIRGHGATAGSDNWWVYLPAVSENAGPPGSPPVLGAISNPDSDGSYSVSWSAVSRASSYTLEEDTNATFSTPSTAYSGPDTSASITGKAVGTYYYRVSASNAWGSSGWSNVESVSVSPPTPPDDADLPCLYAVNWWRNDSPPYNIISSDYAPACLAATEATWDPVSDGTGRWTGYEAEVTRDGKQDFTMDATYTFNYGGGVTGANVVKTYTGGWQYEMKITQFCPPRGQLTGYKVRVNGQLTTVGICP